MLSRVVVYLHLKAIEVNSLKLLSLTALAPLVGKFKETALSTAVTIKHIILSSQLEVCLSQGGSHFPVAVPKGIYWCHPPPWYL